MIERLQTLFTDGDAHAQHGRKVFRMVRNDRTAGSMPCWDYAQTPESEIENTLSLAQNGIDPSATGSQSTLSYQPSFDQQPSREFSFADVIDMVNPLQHIPVVGHFYRKITGDDIKPVSKIIGGTVFGGPAGFAGGMVNLIVEKETGKDIAGNAIALIKDGEAPHFKSRQTQPSNDLPAELLAFSDLSHSSMEEIKFSEPPRKRALWGRD